ncbi:MAG: hypothetical protein KAI75_07785, partial [Desulfobulbaceae bacterium]|nr:hypothetical protein [Desulfobulbaceae bacterium]
QSLLQKPNILSFTTIPYRALNQKRQKQILDRQQQPDQRKQALQKSDPSVFKKFRIIQKVWLFGSVLHNAPR